MAQRNPDEVSGVIKSALFGNSMSLIIKSGKLLCVETNKKIFLAEYDGPNERELNMFVLSNNVKGE